MEAYSLTTSAATSPPTYAPHTTTSFSGRRGRMGAQTARAAASFHVPSRTSRVGPQSSRCALSSCSLLVWLEPIILELDCFVPNEAEMGRGSIRSNSARAFFLSINSRHDWKRLMSREWSYKFFFLGHVESTHLLTPS